MLENNRYVVRNKGSVRYPFGFPPDIAEKIIRYEKKMEEVIVQSKDIFLKGDYELLISKEDLARYDQEHRVKKSIEFKSQVVVN